MMNETQVLAPRHDADLNESDLSPAACRRLQAWADAACPVVESVAPAGLGVEDDEALLDDGCPPHFTDYEREVWRMGLSPTMRSMAGR